MKQLIFTSTAALFAIGLSGAVLAAEAPTAEQCDAWFTKSDTNADGSIGKNEGSDKLVEMMTKNSTNTQESADIITKESFLAECGKGTFGMPTQ